MRESLTFFLTAISGFITTFAALFGYRDQVALGHTFNAQAELVIVYLGIGLFIVSSFLLLRSLKLIPVRTRK